MSNAVRLITLVLDGELSIISTRNAPIVKIWTYFNILNDNDQCTFFYQES